jgi:hypothetical protein
MSSHCQTVMPNTHSSTGRSRRCYSQSNGRHDGQTVQYSNCQSFDQADRQQRFRDFGRADFSRGRTNANLAEPVDQFSAQVQETTSVADSVPAFTTTPKIASVVALGATQSDSIKLNGDDWIGDSGAGSHMTSFRGWFISFEERPIGQISVMLGDDSALDVLGIGSINVKTTEGRVLKMENVLYVPVLKKNLFSLSQLAVKKFEVSMHHCGLRVMFDSKVITTGRLVARGLYVMDFKTVRSIEANSAHTEGAGVEIWHRRLGHINYQTVRKMIKEELVDGVK